MTTEEAMTAESLLRTTSQVHQASTGSLLLEVLRVACMNDASIRDMQRSLASFSQSEMVAQIEITPKQDKFQSKPRQRPPCIKYQVSIHERG
jgi:hypothetical protein